MAAINTATSSPAALPPIPITIDMATLGEQIDIYSQASFHEIKNERDILNLDLYICVIQEEDHTYFFEASALIENYIHATTDGGTWTHPTTRNPVADFAIYLLPSRATNFQLYMDKESVLSGPHSLPIHWNNPAFVLSDRLGLMERYGHYFAETDEQRAITTYELAAQRGSISSKISLAKLYLRKGDKREMRRWLAQSIRAPDIPNRHLLACAKQLEQEGDLPLAREGYRALAQRSNQFGVAFLIQILEGNTELKNAAENARKWRSTLPTGWTSKTMAEYIQHLEQTGYEWQTGEPPL